LEIIAIDYMRYVRRIGMTVKEHYEKHLGNFYTWMVGDFETKVQEHLIYFKLHGIKPFDSSVAIDLGCGHGIQSVALARLGFKVFAIDFNRQLLDELKSNSKEYNIGLTESDIMDFEKYSSLSPNVITCMGDTITHLDTVKDIEDLIENSSKILSSKGKLILSFRDYTRPLIGDQRFIPVKSDENRILTCFLEYTDEKVIVTDLLYEKKENEWVQKVSSYPKLRIGLDEIKIILYRFGYEIDSYENRNGMIYVVAHKPD
jgi:SAM-dependent methyltransferase